MKIPRLLVLLPRLGAASCLLCLGLAAATPRTPVSGTHLDLDWYRDGPDGSAPLPKPVPQHPLGSVTRRDSQGRIIAVVPIRTLNRTPFPGGCGYHALLADSVRNPGAVVNVIFAGTPAAVPGQGSVLNVDGAEFTVELLPPGSPGGASSVSLLARTKAGAGKDIWADTGIIVGTRKGSQTMQPIWLRIRIEQADGTWSAIVGKSTVASHLPLVRSAQSPQVTLLPGPAGSQAWIHDIFVQ